MKAFTVKPLKIRMFGVLAKSICVWYVVCGMCVWYVVRPLKGKPFHLSVTFYCLSALFNNLCVKAASKLQYHIA